jgi:hypothetical protein
MKFSMSPHSLDHARASTVAISLRSSIKRAVVAIILICGCSALFAQDFGFGLADDPGGAENSGGEGFGSDSGGGFGFVPAEPALKAGGEVAGRLLTYNRVFTGDEDFDIERLGDISGKLNVSLTAPYVDAFLNLRFDTDRVEKIDHAQGGIRFTATIGRADLGFQYYTGYFYRPAVTAVVKFPDSQINVDYNRYHQIGVDYAQVLFGFNFRSELGVNLTSDMKGDDPAVENPAVVYSLGFDRDLFWGINLNLQGNGRIRLMQDNIVLSPATPGVIDTEAKIKNITPLPFIVVTTEASPVTSTRITAILSKKFFRDELELKTTALWGIEVKDFLVIPAIVWAKNDLALELSAGFLRGDRDGELGQYRDNSYVKTLLTWKF